ncbi:hypothetical protein QR685DRAFT_203736 [Neurospora intermedia]|uniref:Uncharacterized protein n=1 Tax=Neurospora intermedia TaxID=5142 RepID=A0ABR3DFJ0_NEUIN
MTAQGVYEEGPRACFEKVSLLVTVLYRRYLQALGVAVTGIITPGFLVTVGLCNMPKEVGPWCRQTPPQIIRVMMSEASPGVGTFHLMRRVGEQTGTASP